MKSYVFEYDEKVDDIAKSYSRTVERMKSEACEKQQETEKEIEEIRTMIKDTDQKQNQ